MRAPRVWIVSRDFPPHKGGGVRRVAALASGLRARGFEVETFAARGGPDHVYPGVGHAARRLSGRVKLGWLYRRLLRWSFLFDESTLDWPGLILEAHRHPRPDLIVASAPPHSILVAGALLAKTLGVPWVADYRDPWTEHPDFAPPSPAHRAWFRFAERSTVQTAAGVLTATDEEARHFERLLGDPGRVQRFFNGFDPQTFEGRGVSPPAGPVTVGFYGSFYGSIDPEPLAAAAARAGVVLEHAGADFEGALARAAARHGARLVSLGMLSAEEAAARMQRAHVLALVLPDDPRCAFWRPQKLVEYLASGRPILALVPEGESAALVRRFEAGRVVAPRDVEAATAAIHALADRPSRAALPLEFSWDAQLDRVAPFLARLAVP